MRMPVARASVHAHTCRCGTLSTSAASWMRAFSRAASTERTHSDDLPALDTDEELATAAEIRLANRVEIIVPRTTSAVCARVFKRQVVKLPDRLTVLVSIAPQMHRFIVATAICGGPRRSWRLLSRRVPVRASAAVEKQHCGLSP